MDTTNVPIRTDSQGTTTLVVAVFFGCLTFVVISLRLVARVLVLRHVGPDDGKSACFSPKSELTNL